MKGKGYKLSANKPLEDDDPGMRFTLEAIMEFPAQTGKAK
jgi:hypothetical protein